jgi:Tfp pilus assembly protein FimT
LAPTESKTILPHGEVMTSSITDNENAFTLGEWLTVIVIIGILLAVGIPALTGLSKSTGVQAGVRQFANSLDLARQYAITHRMQAELRVTNTWNAFTIMTNNFPLDKWNYLPVGVVIDSGLSATNVVFGPTGGTTAGSNVVFVIREGTYVAGTLVGISSNFATITVNPILGRATVTRP